MVFSAKGSEGTIFIVAMAYSYISIEVRLGREFW